MSVARGIAVIGRLGKSLVQYAQPLSQALWDIAHLQGGGVLQRISGAWSFRPRGLPSVRSGIDGDQTGVTGAVRVQWHDTAASEGEYVSFDTSDDAFTADVAGLYRVVWSVRARTTTGTGTTLTVAMYINGAEYTEQGGTIGASRHTIQSGPATSQGGTVCAEFWLDLAADDYVTVEVVAVASGTWSLLEPSRFTMQRWE